MPFTVACVTAPNASVIYACKNFYIAFSRKQTTKPTTSNCFAVEFLVVFYGVLSLHSSLKMIKIDLKLFHTIVCFMLSYIKPFKPFHSCETVLVRVHNEILVAIDKRHCVMLLLLDLSAAFDTVDHDILLTRLHSKYSISDIALEWFRSHLTNRSQFALIEGCRSQTREFKCCVTQGSVLGPILSVLYTAPLANILRFHEMQFHFYADDT